ncbi:MAG: protein-L-isoaspartate(D-aspartate) O-methyltransferase [Bacteroidota bacterium]
MGRFDLERKELVNSLRHRGISDERVLGAIGRVERELFVEEPFVNRAYEDNALPICCSQTISQPYTVAFMTQCLDVREGEKVLEVGTGSGYQAAILVELGARVFSIERIHQLLEEARKLFDRLAYRVATKVGDGTIGWSEFAPFDGIIVTAGAPCIPDPLLKQLADGGRLVIPIGDLDIQRLHVIHRDGERFDTKEIYGFKFVPLIGTKGWKTD